MHTWNWQIVRAGTFRLDGGGMFGVVPKTMWSTAVGSDEENRILLDCNCLLLDDGSTKVVVETGFGGKWTDKERGFWDLQRRTIVDALAEVSVDPADVDHVILTHLHFDHAAGLTHEDASGSPVSTFSRAAIHNQRTEWEDALANKTTMRRTYLPSHLQPVADQVQCADGEQEILPGITVMPTPGHTWGHQAVCFDDGAGTICYPGDLLPTVHHVGLAYSLAYDQLPYENMVTKKALLERPAADGWRIVLDHDPETPVVTVARDPDREDAFILNPAECTV